MAQESGPTDTDTTRVVRAFIPSIYIDYGKLLTIPLANELKYEGGIELLFNEKIPLIIEVGSATLTPREVYANGDYEAKGQYLRIGTGVYNQWQLKNKFGLTMRYAVSKFDEVARLNSENINIDRTLSASYDRKDVSASWLELVFYTDQKLFSDTKIKDIFTIGMNLRYRYLLDYDIQTPDDVYAIPGYGRSFDESVPAMNVFLKVSF